ncbi:hypothetical protein M3193_07715 [Sporosarcina luteola]|uniref:hypothetical protein n=1 Tax=Sporosarcina luteola TaxID=582850 RepID=UPI002040EDBC|nr:hypothetical protein [Sporosarcina luteola]MCM3744029.1 hypothetical protein [Sporosarcina luteola]
MGQSYNDKKEEGIVHYFRKNMGRRVFILTKAFPFMFIGKIKSIVEDMVVLDVETTSIPSLEGKEWTVHIHSIEVFYIETGLGAKIPHLKDS